MSCMVHSMLFILLIWVHFFFYFGGFNRVLHNIMRRRHKITKPKTPRKKCAERKDMKQLFNGFILPNTEMDVMKSEPVPGYSIFGIDGQSV